MNPAQLLALLTSWWGDHAPDWSTEIRPAEDRDADPQPGDRCEPGEAEACARDRNEAPVLAKAYPVVNLEEQARIAKYEGGQYKRTRYPLVDLAKRQVIIGLHQMGVERAESSKRWHLVTCHRNIGPSGIRRRIHPLRVRLTATNRLDRSPYHTIAIEVAGNFEGLDGSGNWWMPGTMGRGRASAPQLEACYQECMSIVSEVADLGGKVVAIVPHIIAGRDSKGRPNRQLCCGSRVYSEVGERFAASTGILTAAPGFAIGGLAVPNEWRGPHHDPRLARWRG